MRSLWPLRLYWSFLPWLVAANTASAAVEPAAPPPPSPVVWEAALPDFGQASYSAAVERLVSDYETQTGRPLLPGARRRVGLKIYTDSGAGLSTPPTLVLAVIAALERRGFAPNQIFLVGLSQVRLRATGFLPALSKGGNSFAEHPVFVLESGRFYDSQWFYDSPLPARFAPAVLERKADDEEGRPGAVSADRKSFLATPLFLEADFWINLPVYSDHPVLGINGALVNATLWNASNTQRFFNSPANAPAAVAEMAAIPELRESWRLTIVSLECYQFIGGPLFNSLYTASERRLWLGADPVLLDALMIERLNAERKHAGFRPLLGDDRRLLDFCEQLGVGTARTSRAVWRRP
jgi:hypothetical protein